jgi:hypothetical protein
LRDAVTLAFGAALVSVSPVLPVPQQFVFGGGGGVLMVTGIVFLVLRQIRSYRDGSES